MRHLPSTTPLNPPLQSVNLTLVTVYAAAATFEMGTDQQQLSSYGPGRMDTGHIMDVRRGRVPLLAPERSANSAECKTLRYSYFRPHDLVWTLYAT